MHSPTSNPQAIPEPTSGSRSKLLGANFKKFISKPAIAHPQKAYTVEMWNAEQSSKNEGVGEVGKSQDDISEGEKKI
jgi:hypothetical protein